MRRNLENYNKKAGFSLVEVLLVLLIFSTVIIIAVSLMLKSARISINNEISDRANTIGVRVLETTKKPDSNVFDCNTGLQMSLTDGVYSIGNTIDFTKPSEESVCFIKQSVSAQSALISSCNSTYEVNIVFPQPSQGKTYVAYSESYCAQIIVESIAGSNLKKVSVAVVYDTLSEVDLRRVYYGFK